MNTDPCNNTIQESFSVQMKQHVNPNFNLLADRTSPGASFTVHLEVRLKVKTLYMLTVVTSGWQCDFLESDGTLQGYLDGCLLHSIPFRII